MALAHDYSFISAVQSTFQRKFGYSYFVMSLKITGSSFQLLKLDGALDTFTINLKINACKSNYKRQRKTPFGYRVNLPSSAVRGIFLCGSKLWHCMNHVQVNHAQMPVQRVSIHVQTSFRTLSCLDSVGHGLNLTLVRIVCLNMVLTRIQTCSWHL
jgi:hypothetical protein